MPRIHQLGLEQREIHVRRAFDRAGFAGEAIAQRRVELLAPQRIILEAQLQRGANRVRPTTGRHVFLSGREKGRTHGRRVLPASATAVALLEVAEERFVLEGKRQRRFKQKSQPRLLLDAQMIVDLEPAIAENFAGIEEVLRIEQLLDLPHYA